MQVDMGSGYGPPVSAQPRAPRRTLTDTPPRDDPPEYGAVRCAPMRARVHILRPEQYFVVLPYSWEGAGTCPLGVNPPLCRQCVEGRRRRCELRPATAYAR